MQGTLLKMKTELTAPVSYSLPIGDELLELNQFLGKKISFSFTGNIYCIATGEKIKKTYNSGYSYKAFATLAQCDLCIVKPELCHYDQGTCREPKWGEEHCFKPHIIYLSNTSDVKIGITREVNTPYRWIDQGAIEALPILKVKDRKTSGMIESEIAKEMKDKTNWRKMLKGEHADVDLYAEQERVYELFGDLIDEYDAEDLDSEIVEIEYPILELPEKMPSLNLDKKPEIEATLLGIKGQYLILDIGVFNIRRHQGYEINWKA